MYKNFNQEAIRTIKTANRDINIFKTSFASENIDHSVVNSFGEEWSKFNVFNDKEIKKAGDMYFDILTDEIVNANTYALDVGCGTGRWTKYLSDKLGFIEAIDPSQAIFAANELLSDVSNIRLSQASTDNIPFPDATFDFVMSIGVLHHIPNTAKAMEDCVKKLKIGGYFYVYLYYDFENKGLVFKSIFAISNFIRKVVCKLPGKLKRFTCDLISIFIYMPFILMGRFLKWIGLKNWGKKIILNGYQDQSFYIIRNDALDRFGTSLEQRFSKKQIREMLENAGLCEIKIADSLPYWHAIGKRSN
jgi:ubiquinone/menaquinone biosynthesis C-methylase UbiE